MHVSTGPTTRDTCLRRLGVLFKLRECIILSKQSWFAVARLAGPQKQEGLAGLQELT